MDWNANNGGCRKTDYSHTLRGCVDWNIHKINTTFTLRCHTLRGCVDWNESYIPIDNYCFVTPCVGVWIETGTFGSRQRFIQCHTLRGCVDWNFAVEDGNIGVLSHTLRGCVDWNPPNWGFTTPIAVTPCVGVWIETFLIMKRIAVLWVTPCVGVWIETSNTRNYGTWLMSHPAWVCGLKQKVGRR